MHSKQAINNGARDCSDLHKSGQNGAQVFSGAFFFFFFFLPRVKRFFCLMCNIGKFISVHKFLRISHVLILSTVNHLSSSKVLIFKMRWLFQRDALLSLQLSCQSVQTSLISSGIWTHFKISTHTLWDPIPSSNLL